MEDDPDNLPDIFITIRSLALPYGCPKLLLRLGCSEPSEWKYSVLSIYVMLQY